MTPMITLMMMIMWITVIGRGRRRRRKEGGLRMKPFFAEVSLLLLHSEAEYVAPEIHTHTTLAKLDEKVIRIQ